jgi:hypothetical protein
MGQLQRHNDDQEQSGAQARVYGVPTRSRCTIHFTLFRWRLVQLERRCREEAPQRQLGWPLHGRSGR